MLQSELYKYGKYKHSNKKHLCERCKIQFTCKSGKKNIKDYPKCLVCGKYIYLYHKYKYYVSFKCNDTIKQLILRAIADS